MLGLGTGLVLGIVSERVKVRVRVSLRIRVRVRVRLKKRKCTSLFNMYELCLTWISWTSRCDDDLGNDRRTFCLDITCVRESFLAQHWHEPVRIFHEIRTIGVLISNLSEKVSETLHIRGETDDSGNRYRTLCRSRWGTFFVHWNTSYRQFQISLSGKICKRRNPLRNRFRDLLLYIEISASNSLFSTDQISIHYRSSDYKILQSFRISRVISNRCILNTHWALSTTPSVTLNWALNLSDRRTEKSSHDTSVYREQVGLKLKCCQSHPRSVGQLVGTQGIDSNAVNVRNR